MADRSKIEWTDASWNPLAGCSLVSPGCTNCYAMQMAHRLGSNPKTPHYAGTTKVVNGQPVWTGQVNLAPEHVLTSPLRRRKPTIYFVNSMSDLFHEDVPDEVLDRIFAVMWHAGWRQRRPGRVEPPRSGRHTFQVLTKRSARAREYLTNLYRDREGAWLRRGFSNPLFGPTRWPMPNAWIIISAEDQRRLDERLPDLVATPAAVRGVSLEPLLGPIDLTPWLAQIDWVIVGGESGPGARPMHPDWARSLRDQCAAAGVPFFFKQWGEWFPGEIEANCGESDPGRYLAYPDVDHDPSATEWIGRWRREEVGGVGMLRVGKKRAGRLLDGVVHNAMPEVGA